jgi:hypothetical protein
VRELRELRELLKERTEKGAAASGGWQDESDTARKGRRGVLVATRD